MLCMPIYSDIPQGIPSLFPATREIVACRCSYRLRARKHRLCRHLRLWLLLHLLNTCGECGEVHWRDTTEFHNVVKGFCESRNRLHRLLYLWVTENKREDRKNFVGKSCQILLLSSDVNTHSDFYSIHLSL